MHGYGMLPMIFFLHPHKYMYYSITDTRMPMVNTNCPTLDYIDGFFIEILAR